MNWRIFLTAFTSLFLAEFGDKTQLAVISLAASTRKPWPVFLGAVLALALVTGLGILFGEVLQRFIPEAGLRKIAGALFMGIGVWIWFRP